MFSKQELQEFPELNRRVGKAQMLYLFEIHSDRMYLLSTEETALVKLFMSVRNYRTIAKMAGVNEATVARRLKNAVLHITFAPANALPGKVIETVKEHFLNGMNIKTISEKTGVSRYRIKKITRHMRKS
ncbi:MAG: hypothetical protein JW806_01330 [Sedimentisphaerales bacterium]|nr:hypothetical protein [Sedimentisphaerales bacterium]